MLIHGRNNFQVLSVQGLDHKHNIHDETGLMILGEQMVATKPDSPAWISMNCGTWVWLSRGSTLRGLVAGMKHFFAGTRHKFGTRMPD